MDIGAPTSLAEDEKVLAEGNGESRGTPEFVGEMERRAQQGSLGMGTCAAQGWEGAILCCAWHGGEMVLRSLGWCGYGQIEIGLG